MLDQLLKYSPFYGLFALACFLLGWHANARLSSFGEEFDPRIEGRW